MTDEPPQGRKPRRKATTEVGRQILQKERQRLAREAATLGEAMANEARAALHARTWERSTVTPQRAAISRGIVRRVGAVLASERVNVPINVRPTASDRDSMSAWTDFRKIDVTYKDYEDKRLVAATLRGLIYHEGGHCRFSLPFATLCEGRDVNGQRIIDTSMERTYQRAWNCLEDQRMETAVTSDSPRKAAYLTPMIMTEHCRTVDSMAANYPLLVWRKYLPKHMRQHARKMFVKLHEDKGGEAIALELESIVTSYVLATDVATMLQAVMAYHALLTRMHPLASNMNDAGHQQQRYARKRIERDDLEDFLTIPVSPDMANETLDDPTPMADEDEDEPEDEDDTIDTTDPAVARQLAEIMWPLWWTPWNIVLVRYVEQGGEPEPSEGDGQGGFGSLLDSQDGESDDEDEESGDSDVADNADHGGGEVTPPVEDDADNSDTEDEDEDEGADEDGGESDDGTHGGDSGTHTSDDAEGDFTQQDLDELLQAAEDERDTQRELDGDMEAFARESDNQTSKLDVYVGGVSDDGLAISAAEALAEDIERSFTAATMDRAPAWVEGQRRGVLNVLRYQTRQPGDAEVFRAWTEDDAPGYDIAVSLALDYSSSMSSEVGALAQAGFASKRACDNLGIPCTVTLWDTSARVLWDANERAEALPVIAATGGTDPTTALADLDNQRCDRPKHIVLIMTDGDWNEGWPTAGGYKVARRGNAPTKRHLAAYKDAGRLLVGFGYGSESLAEGLIAKGCDEAFGITDLMEIPRHLERILLRLA